MCLEECPVGWSANPDLIDPACWKDCPAGWNTVSWRARTLAALRKATRGPKNAHSPARPELDLIALAISGRKVGFQKVIKMIDEMVANLQREQIDDENKKEYCEKQFDISEDKKKELELSVSDSETAIEEMEGSIEKLTEELKALAKGIKALG